MESWLNVARGCLLGEAAAVNDVMGRLGSSEFASAVTRVNTTAGKVIFSGVGKSGLIARRGAAVLSSVGVDAHFVHPTDALHGDCGYIRPDDLLIGLSHSGTTIELNAFLEHVSSRVYTIGITSNATSALGRVARELLTYPPRFDGGVHGFLPTVSCAAQTAYLDALAVGVATIRDVDPATFKTHHPGGNLGQTLS